MIHKLALIGEPPQDRDWHEGDPIFEPEIDESARVEAFATIDAGKVRPTRIGARTWVMRSAHVGHDVWVGDDCEITPFTSLGGHSTIGHGVRFGQAVIVKPGVTIGDGARLGMGAVVLRDVPAGEVWAGNPARMIESSSGELRRLATGLCNAKSETEQNAYRQAIGHMLCGWPAPSETRYADIYARYLR